MRAVVLTEPGSVPTLAQLEVPEPGEGEVRVHVHAASVNGFDLAVAAGYLTGMMEHRYPVVLGKDFAGIVDAVGAGVTDYTAGERVFGVVTKPYLGDGSFGEYVVVPVAVGLAKLPASVGFPEGAALGLAGPPPWTRWTPHSCCPARWSWWWVPLVGSAPKWSRLQPMPAPG